MKPPLTMTCSTSRSSGGRDSFGQSNDFDAVLTSQACYWWSDTPARVAGGEASAVAIENEHILFELGANVQQGDRVTTVTDHLGNTVFGASSYRVIEHVAVQRNHLDCTLRYGKVIGGRA